LQAPIALMLGWLSFGSADIKNDEAVVFYPTYASWDAQQSNWLVSVHGAIFEPELDSRKRAVLIHTLRGALRIDKASAEAKLLTQRLQLFLVDSERGKTVSIQLGSQQHQLNASEPNGHFYGSFRLTEDEANKLLAGPVSPPAWLPFEAVTNKDDQRQFLGRVQFVTEQGLSVISDIDDTVKETLVTERTQMLANTFTRKFRAVDGMAQMYRSAEDKGAVFHYVSGSPWQLYVPLSAFFAEERLPPGSYHLKHFRMKDSTLLELFASHEASKNQAIGDIVTSFPRRRFVLVGDSGEQDPEIYGVIARRFGDRIAAIFIRDVTNEPKESERYATAFRDIEPAQWHVFSKPEQIQSTFLELFQKE
jgi:hypothetical protein